MAFTIAVRESPYPSRSHISERDARTRKRADRLLRPPAMLARLDNRLGASACQLNERSIVFKGRRALPLTYTAIDQARARKEVARLKRRAPWRDGGSLTSSVVLTLN